MELSDKIKKNRINHGLSQEELALKLFVSRSAIAKWETGKGKPDLVNLKQLAKIFNVSVDELLDDSSENKTLTVTFPIDWNLFSKKPKILLEDQVVCYYCQKADQIYRLQDFKFHGKWWNMIWFFTDWFGKIALEAIELPELIKNRAVYYLTIEKNQSFLVSINKEFLMKQRLTQNVPATCFKRDGKLFFKAKRVK